MNYEVVFVDWDGTLSDSKFWDRWKDSPEFADAYSKIQSALFQSAAGKDIAKSWMTGFKKYEGVLTYLAGSTGLSTDELEDELRYSAENMSFIDEHILTKVLRLREIGKHVVIATDNMDTFSAWTVPALKLDDHFDQVLNSHYIRKLKTDIRPLYNRSEFFHDYLKKMGVAPVATVLIDNSLDTKCIESIGMNFLHVTYAQPLSYHLDEILRIEANP